jgi:hypothetical protein
MAAGHRPATYRSLANVVWAHRASHGNCSPRVIRTNQLNSPLRRKFVTRQTYAASAVCVSAIVFFAGRGFDLATEGFEHFCFGQTGLVASFPERF